MSDFKIIGPVTFDQAIDETSTTQKAPLGMIVLAEDQATTDYGVGEFQYCLGVASTVVGSAAKIDTVGFATSLLTANDTGQVGTAMSINVASQYGWYQISGLGVVKGLASLADNKPCYATATAGSVDDAVVSGDLVYGMTTASALDTPSSGLALVNLSRPNAMDA